MDFIRGAPQRPTTGAIVYEFIPKSFLGIIPKRTVRTAVVHHVPIMRFASIKPSPCFLLARVFRGDGNLRGSQVFAAELIELAEAFLLRVCAALS